MNESFDFQTKYHQLANLLKERLASQPNGGKLPSVRALMKRYQVSQHTVMSALRLLEHEQLISRRQGSGIYRSDSKRAPVIAYCRPVSSSHIIEIQENMLLEACVQRHWKLDVHRFYPKDVHVFADEIHADGVVLSPELVTFNSPLINRLLNNSITRVVLGRDTSSAHLDFATGDDSSMLRELVKGLVARGHRSIAFFVSEAPFYEINERVKNFRQMCHLLDLEAHVLDMESQYGRDGIARAATFLHEYFAGLGGRRLPFTAMITCSSVGSVPALRAFHQAGYRVPEDCSLCCMGSDPYAEYAIPSITNASPPYADLAAAALRVLEQRFKGDASPLLYERVSFLPVWRESVGMAPALKSEQREQAAVVSGAVG